jgi:hypothetical protein
MVVLAKLLNDGALWLTSAYDRVCPSPVPCIKNTHVLALIAFCSILTHPLLRNLTVWILGSSLLSPV